VTTTAKSTAAGLAWMAALALPAAAAADFELPRESPPARVSQQVGLTEIAVEYDSPSVKGRRVWGALVPYDRPWSISAGRPPLVRFSRDVMVAGQPVAAGAYRLSAVPGREQWTFVLARIADPAASSAPADAKLPATPPAVRFKARARPAPPRDRLTFLFSDFTDDRTSLDLEWEKLRVSIPIATYTARQVMAGVGDLDTLWRSFASAARYMLETKKDFDAGLRYADQSLALKDDWYTHWIKAALLAAKHDYAAAIDEGERAYQLGQSLGDRFVLEPELRKALAAWKTKI
jgi:hypothetical protein